MATEHHIEELDALLATATLRPDVVIALQPISQKPRATQLAPSPSWALVECKGNVLWKDKEVSGKKTF